MNIAVPLQSHSTRGAQLNRQAAQTVLSLSSINHRSHAVAHQIHVVQMAAYKQEAELLRVDRFPPLERTVDDVQTSLEEFIGAFEGGTLAGVLSACPDEEGRGIGISSLVVRPAYRRWAIGNEPLELVKLSRSP